MLTTGWWRTYNRLLYPGVTRVYEQCVYGWGGYVGVQVLNGWSGSSTTLPYRPAPYGGTFSASHVYTSPRTAYYNIELAVGREGTIQTGIAIAGLYRVTFIQ